MSMRTAYRRVSGLSTDGSSRKDETFENVDRWLKELRSHADHTPPWSRVEGKSYVNLP